MYLPSISEFSPFDLKRLLTTCFGQSDKLLSPCILIDLVDINLIKDLKFYSLDNFDVQKRALDHFWYPLNGGIGKDLNYSNCDLYAYKSTGGSNLDPENILMNPSGKQFGFSEDICPKYDLIFAISDYSLTAPLTAMAKTHGFRGATLHGVNDIILNSGLSVDYTLVSRQAESFRQILDMADSFTLYLECLNQTYELTIQCGNQTAQKSHGLCPPGLPDVANLPAGEVYFVPTSANGSFPFKFSDGTLARMDVADGKICECSLLSGNQDVVTDRSTQLREDPATGIIGELGFGTQLLPFSGKDIQDEKILGTCHVATGRSDHLGGNLTPNLFKSRKNASHDDILFSPNKTPEINITKVEMSKGGTRNTIIEDFSPSDFVLNLLGSEYPVDRISSAKALPM